MKFSLALLCLFAVCSASFGATKPKLTKSCSLVIADMAGAGLGDIDIADSGLEMAASPMSVRSAVARGVGFESLELPQPPVPDEDAKVRKALSNFSAFIEKLYGNDHKPTLLPTPTDKMHLNSRIILRLASLEGEFRIPRRLLEKLDEETRHREMAIRALDEQIAFIAEQMGDAYRPAFYLKVLHTIEEFGQSSRVMAKSDEFFGPLIKVIYAHSQDFLEVLRNSAMLDEAQAQVLTLVMNAVLAGKIDLNMEANRAAVEDVLLANLRSSADSLAPETYATLRQLNGAWESAIDRAIYIEKQLEASRRAYGANYYAASICYYILAAVARPDGNPALDQDNVLLRAQVRELDNQPFLRSLVLAAMGDERTYVHPTLNEVFKFKLGKANDAILVRQVDTYGRRKAEFARALKQAREEELAMIKAIVSEKDWAKIEAKMKSVAKVTVDNVLGSTGVKSLPAPFVKAIVEHLGDAKQTAKGETAKEVKLIKPPDDLPSYLNASTVKTPWKLDALDFVKDFQASEVGGRGYVYVTRVLAVLDEQAKVILAEDFAMQKEAAEKRKPLDPKKTAELARKSRELLEALAQINHALDVCFVQNGHTEAEADLLLAWHIGENFPTIQRLVINHVSHPALTGLRRRLVVHAVTSAFGGEAVKLTPERAGFRFPMQLIRKHKIKSAIFAAVTLVGGIGWYFWPTWFKPADVPVQDPPAIVRPIEEPKPDKPEVKPEQPPSDDN